jgi:hypothetical protein
MTARIFWILAAGLSLLAMAIMLAGGPESGGIVDYRAWLLLAVGLLAAAIGNFSRTSHH